MQPIGSYRTSDPLSDPPSGAPPDPGAANAPRAPPDPAAAAGPDPGFRLTSPLVKAAAADAVRRREQDRVMRQGLDAFRASMTPIYQTPEGEVCVATPFAMSTLYQNQQATLRAGAALHIAPAALRAKLSASALAQILAARGAPQDIQRLTQALIDLGYLSKDPSVPLGQRVRAMMFDHGIGIDCAGYTQQAYLRGAGVSRTAAGFKPEPMDESLAGLHGRGYTRVADPRDMRPGDLVVLAAPTRDDVGHRAIVYDQHSATVAEMRDLLAHDGPTATFSLGGPIQVLLIDSSWGAGVAEHVGDPRKGGVLRETWWHNTATGAWAWTTGGSPYGALVMSPNVYNHPLEGFYRRQDPASAHPGKVTQ